LGLLFVDDGCRINDPLQEMPTQNGDDPSSDETIVPLLQINGLLVGADAVESPRDPGPLNGELDKNQGHLNTGVLQIGHGVGLVHENLGWLDVPVPAIGGQIGALAQIGLDEGARVLGGGRFCHNHLGIAGHEEAVVDSFGFLA